MFPNTNLFTRAHHLRGCDLLGHRKRHAHNTSSLCAAVAQPFNLYPFQQCFVIYMAWYYGWFKNKTMKNQQKKRQQQQQQPIVCILRLLCVTKLSLFFHFIRLDIWFWSFFRVNLLIFHFEKSLTMDRFFLSRSRSVCKWWFYWTFTFINRVWNIRKCYNTDKTNEQTRYYSIGMIVIFVVICWQRTPLQTKKSFVLEIPSCFASFAWLSFHFLQCTVCTQRIHLEIVDCELLADEKQATKSNECWPKEE